MREKGHCAVGCGARLTGEECGNVCDDCYRRIVPKNLWSAAFKAREKARKAS